MCGLIPLWTEYLYVLRECPESLLLSKLEPLDLKPFSNLHQFRPVLFSLTCSQLRPCILLRTPRSIGSVLIAGQIGFRREAVASRGAVARPEEEAIHQGEG